MKKFLLICAGLLGIAAVIYAGIVIYTILFDETGTA